MERLLRLFPLLFFVFFFFGSALASGSFYAMPIMVVFVLMAIISFIVYRYSGFEHNLAVFSKHAGDSNIIMMILIFILAGGYAELAKSIGSVKAVCDICLYLMPQGYLIPSIFGICMFVSFAMGSSMGTVLAMAPIASQLASESGFSLPILLGAVLGGSMFGDNLSTISDTTIAAVNTQNCKMEDKFVQNFWMVFPCAVLAALLYLYLDRQNTTFINLPSLDLDFIKTIPYIFVFSGAVLKLNVFVLLISGIFLTLTIGYFHVGIGFMELFQAFHKGIVSIEDLALLSLIAAGTSGLLQENGGLESIINRVNRFATSKKKAEFGIGFLGVAFDLLTANNTVAIVMAGPIAKKISNDFDIQPKRSASILDVFTSSVQGIIPYGAQVLAAAAIGGVAPMNLVFANYYCFLTFIAAIVTIGCK